jgi:hypothetical protein
VVGWCRRPSIRRSVAEARWCQSPRFSASLIGLRVRVCGGAAGTVNVGSRTLASLSFIWRCARGDPLPQNGRRPRSGRVSDRETDPEIIPKDHIPTFKRPVEQINYKFDLQIPIDTHLHPNGNKHKPILLLAVIFLDETDRRNRCSCCLSFSAPSSSYSKVRLWLATGGFVRACMPVS